MTSRQMEIDAAEASRSPAHDDGTKKKNRTRTDPSANAVTTVAKARDTSFGSVKPVVKGDINIISLCISTCGTRAWARKRDTHALVYLDFHDYPVEWKDCRCGTNVGAFGMTRCGASGVFIVLQAHSTGLITMTDGQSSARSVHLVQNQDGLGVVPPEAYNPKMQQCSLKAVVPVHTIGFVAVVEKIGLVFVSLSDCFVPANTAVVLMHSPANPEAETGTDMEATISVHGHQVAVAQKQIISIVNIATGQVENSIPVKGLGEDERVWQLEMRSRTLCVSTPQSIAWLDTRKNAWGSSQCNAAMACHACDTQDTIAMITAMGDVVAIDALGRSPAKRLEQGSVIEPYASTHTRDGIAAWGGKYAHSLKLLKTGGEIHEVRFI